MRFIKAESYRRGIISSTIFNIAAKGIGFINSLLIIYIFGSGLNTDFYFLILATVTLLTSFINGIDLLILVPEAMRLRVNEGEHAEKSFLNFFILGYLIIGILIALLVFVAPIFFYSIFSKYEESQLGDQRLMLVLSAVLFPIQLLNSLFVSILTSHRYFTVPMMVNLVNSIISITVLVLLGNSLSIKGAVIAMMAGYAANFIWLLYFFRKKLQWNFFERPIRPAKRIVKNISLLQLNILPVSLRSYIIVFLLTGLGSGIITAYNYGQQIALIPHMLITSQVIAVAGVKFNELSSQWLKERLNELLMTLLRLLYVIIIPIAAIMALTSTEIVSEIFKYSDKILPETITNIALVLLFIALTLPSQALDLTITRILMAQQKIREGVIYGVVIHVVITLLVFVGISIYGLKGFLIAYFFGQNIFLPVLFYFLLKKVTPFIQYLKWIMDSLPFILFNVALFISLFLAKKYFFQDVNALLLIFGMGLIYTVGVILFNRLNNYYPPLNTVINKLVLRK